MLLVLAQDYPSRIPNPMSQLGLNGGLDATSVHKGPTLRDTLGPHQPLDMDLQTQKDPKADSFRPGPPSPMSTHSDPRPRTSFQGVQSSKKILRKEFSRLGRNLRQRLLCGYFAMNGNGSDQRFNNELGEESSG